ncbi:MAG: hypothetical protein WKF57_05010 [Nakamurella sp.]
MDNFPEHHLRPVLASGVNRRPVGTVVLTHLVEPADDAVEDPGGEDALQRSDGRCSAAGGLPRAENLWIDL